MQSISKLMVMAFEYVALGLVHGGWGRGAGGTERGQQQNGGKCGKAGSSTTLAASPLRSGRKDSCFHIAHSSQRARSISWSRLLCEFCNYPARRSVTALSPVATALALGFLAGASTTSHPITLK